MNKEKEVPKEIKVAEGQVVKAEIIVEQDKDGKQVRSCVASVMLPFWPSEVLKVIVE